MAGGWLVDGRTRIPEEACECHMRIDFQLGSGITFRLDSSPAHNPAYPTARIQKGLVMIYEGQELCEEAVGFGVPILKRGLQTIFPSAVELSPLPLGYLAGVHARFTMNLEERIKKTGSSTLRSPILYKCKNILAAFIRWLPFTRSFLTHASSILRSTLAWETTYETTDFSTNVTLTYTMDAQKGRIMVDLELPQQHQAGTTEIIVMNEQGAHFFERYQDTDGVSLLGNEIGCWDEVKACEAKFVSPGQGISFSLSQADKARLYRGRELIGGRLAWAGFGYICAPGQDHFSYEITVGKSP